MRRAEAAEIFYKAQGLFEKAQEAQELKLRCIRQAGTILLPPEQGGSTVREVGGRPEKNSVGNLTSFQETLDGAGISPNTALVWQKVARVPEDKFEVYFTEADYYKDELKIILKQSLTNLRIWVNLSKYGERFNEFQTF